MSDESDESDQSGGSGSDQHPNSSRSWFRQRADLYQQLAPGESMLPPWARNLYIWVMGTFTGALLTWLVFRLTGAVRGDLAAALIALSVGIITGSVAVWFFTGRHRQRK